MNRYSQETYAPLMEQGVYGKIKRLARPYYYDSGPNSWTHIMLVYSQAVRFAQHTDRRQITPVEYAAVLFHDSSCKARPDKVDHNIYGAENARKELTGVLAPEEVDEVCQAIVEHTDKDGNWTSVTSELLAAADFNPPDYEWLVHKSYCYNKRRGLSDEETYERVPDTLRSMYGSHGSVKMPSYYIDYYGPRIREQQRKIDKLTPGEVERVVTEYRRKQNRAPGDWDYGEPSCEAYLVTIPNQGSAADIIDNLFRSMFW